MSKPKWCKHIKWDTFYEDYEFKNEFIIVPPWDFCPICGKKRPKAELLSKRNNNPVTPSSKGRTK